MYPIEEIPDNDTLNRWAYDPAVSELPPTKGLKFKSEAPHNGCESFNWAKYLDSTLMTHTAGAAKTKASQKYLGYYVTNVKVARTVHQGKSYEQEVWFEVIHTPLPDNQAHTDIKIIKRSANKAFAKRAKVDLASEAMSELIVTEVQTG